MKHREEKREPGKPEKPEEKSQKPLLWRLQEKLHFVENLMEYIPLPVFFKDRQGNIMGCNHTLEEYFGVDRSNIVGKTARDLFPKELAERELEIDEALFARPGIKHYEARLPHSDGTLHDALVSKSTFTNLEGEVAGLVGIILDITERKRAEDELLRETEVKTAVAELSRFLLTNLSMGDISGLVIDYARRLTSSCYGFVGYFDTATGSLADVTISRETREKPDVSDGSAALKKVEGLWGWILGKSDPQLINDAAIDPHASGISVDLTPVRNILSAPALIGEAHVGIIVLTNSDRDYNETDLALLESLADHYALAVQRMRTEEALFQSKEFAESIIETAEAMVVMRDRQGNIWMFNQAAEDVTGYSRDELLGSNWFEVLMPRDRYPRAWEKFEEFREGKSFEKEPFAYPILTKKGEERYISWRSSEVRERGQVTGLISIGIDITERREALEALRRSEEYFRTLTEDASDIITIIDATGTIEFESASIFHVLGYEQKELEGRNLLELIHPEDLPGLMQDLREYSKVPDATVFRVCRFRHKDGHWCYMEGSGKNLLENPNVRGIVLNSRDVSERVERERQMEDLNRELQAFASTLSHDLKSPLGSALGYAATLRRIYSERLDETGREGLDVMVTSLERINGIIEGMLDYTRAGHAGDRMGEMVLGLMVEGIAEELRESGALSGVDLAIKGELPMVTGDPLRLYQVFANLISNAAKFTSGRPGATVEVGCEKRDGEDVIYVKDNGSGIPSDQLKRIFEPLARTADARGIPGHGLGLAIVKRAVESWGGRVWAESDYGRGATFFFTIPIS